MNTPVVYDELGRQLQLTTTRLIEVEGSANPRQPWYVLYSDINRAVRTHSNRVVIRMHESVKLTRDEKLLVILKTKGTNVVFGFDPDEGTFRIGCRHFSEENFGYILKVAKEQMRNRKARAAKAKKK